MYVLENATMNVPPSPYASTSNSTYKYAVELTNDCVDELLVSVPSSVDVL